MAKINMFWYKVPFGKKNFGDELGPYIVKKLSGQRIAYIPLLHNTLSKKSLLAYPAALYARKMNGTDIVDNLKFLFSNKGVLITVGSIIGWYSSPKCIIWGAGIMASDQNINKATFCAVRGKFTQKRLRELGLNPPAAIGDPALLMPLLYNPEIKAQFKLGIIPHHFHYEEVKKREDSKDILIINLLEEVEKVIDDMLSCEIVISSSLHGIIIAHAYNKPCIWVNLSAHSIGGDDIKFADYFSSVNIIPYERFSFNLKDYDDAFIEKIHHIIKENPQISLPEQSTIATRQSELIQSAPFEVLDIYNPATDS
ncbi:polysaccharide pyruvyl transferase family protein [Abyssalbus ytuae]|uniref:Polysaccharide pyruvyl transferase family protein n=1 Tax=Abyssalbus ytuae TaxID=2926907 RepID=A0A9E6ZQS4_9FLAO|nr:polysaccharide pyruvyl transferase family protein [Abyssalbus ytuae]UOB17073.1 polysaccharide pyruvyl transferase family protein [Abyssalbus ytuae]